MTNRNASPRKAGTSGRYHHGNLVEALIAATIALVEEKGVENVSVRDVARKAGVSSGAPFRHFASKTALLTAVAEQAISRLTAAVADALAEAGERSPLEELRAIGRGYLRWATENPTHFQIVSSRTLIDFQSSARLVDENEAIRMLMVDLIDRARNCGELSADIDADDLMVTLRGFAYGLARLWIDGHYPEWQVKRPPEEQMVRSLDLFMDRLRKDPGHARPRADLDGDPG